MVAVVVGYLAFAGGDDDAAAPRGNALAAPTASPVQPAPDGGDVSETVAPGKAGKTVRAKLSKAARLGDGVQVKVLSTRTTTVKPHGPGEGGGPALVGRVEIRNTSKRPIDVGGAMVTLLYGDDQVAQPSTSAPSAPFRGTLRRGEAGRGVYVFRMPSKRASSISLVVQYGAGAGVARFVS